jgi:hypothetical protein
MRAVIGLLVYLLAVSAIVSVGIMGAMAFEMSFVEQIPFAQVTSGASHEKPTFIQATVSQSKVRRLHHQRKTVRVTHKERHKVPTMGSGLNAYAFSEPYTVPTAN